MSDTKLMRVEVKAPCLCLTDWLAAQPQSQRYYWSDRQRHTEMAGIGEAHVVSPEGMSPISEAFRQIHQFLPENYGRARYYGGFRFHFNSREDTKWKHFKQSRFVVPLLEFYRKGTRCTLDAPERRRWPTRCACPLIRYNPTAMNRRYHFSMTGPTHRTIQPGVL